jgi:hypothetical protein
MALCRLNNPILKGGIFIMNKSFAVIITAFMFVAVSTTSLYANNRGITYTGKAPVTANSQVNTLLDAEFAKMLESAGDRLSNIGGMPDFVKSMSNANAFAANAATHRSIVNYSLLAVTVGSSIGTVGSPGGAAGKLTDEGDLAAGVGIQTWAFQVGINAGLFPFLPDGLYLAFKYGKTEDVKVPFRDEYRTSSQTYGVLANYKLAGKLSLLGLIGYRGISLGSGILIQQNELDFNFRTARQTMTPAQIGEYNVGMDFRPNLHMKLNSNAVIVPLEVSTSIILPILSIGVGVGADMNFGRTKLDLSARAPVNVTGIDTIEEGNITAAANIKNQNPKFFTPKVMFGPSMWLGPVMIEVPISYYFSDQGYSIGFTAGIVF